jgi:hypothetical protein
VKGQDRIAQAGDVELSDGDVVATLAEFASLQPSPDDAQPADENVVYNAVDAAVAQLIDPAAFTQAFLAARKVPAAIAGAAVAQPGDSVYKIGRTTGLTHGVVKDVHTYVGPVPYGCGNVWFKESLTVEGDQGTLFSDHGDSGAIVVKSDSGEIVGLLYASNGTHSFACPIDAVLAALGCAL